jgi:hypothetical protein
VNADYDLEMDVWNLPLIIFRELAPQFEWLGNSKGEPTTADIELDFCASYVETKKYNSVLQCFSVDEQSPNISATADTSAFGNVPGDCLENEE